jgi:endonuclease/exonuclease/phosphatase family metal-dependent hydrolase
MDHPDCEEGLSMSLTGGMLSGAEDMLIMTFNLRFENDLDGENGWVYRRGLVLDVIRRFSPSILGTQEGTFRQLSFLRENLPEYRMLAPPRHPDETCQYPTLFCRGESFEVKEAGEFWLSRTPDIHRSKDWDSAYPRMMSFGQLEAERSKEPFWVVVTHLDNIGSTARLEQAKVIARWLKERSGARILMGDFNDTPDSEVHRFLTGPDASLLDTWQVLGKKENQTSMTHHDFKGVPQRCRMDWILVSRELRVKEAFIVRDHCEGRYPSDHFPYAAKLRLPRAAPVLQVVEEK